MDIGIGFEVNVLRASYLQIGYSVSCQKYSNNVFIEIIHFLYGVVGTVECQWDHKLIQFLHVFSGVLTHKGSWFQLD